MTLWELSTDRRLFRVEGDLETLERVIAGVVPNPMDLVEGYPPALWDVLRRGLAHDPNQRYASAAEFALALDAFCRTQGEPVTPKTVEDILDALFTDEKANNGEWLAKAEQSDAPVVATTLRPGAAADERMADMPEIPGPPSVPFRLALGDFAPPSLPILPGNEHQPISSDRLLKATGSHNAVPFEYIRPDRAGDPDDDAPKSVQLGAKQLAEQRQALQVEEDRLSELPAPVTPSASPSQLDRQTKVGTQRIALIGAAVVVALVVAYFALR